MRVLKRFLVFASLLGVALFAVTLSTMAPATAFAEPGISPARIKSEQVVDTYYHYACSKNSSHNMDYNHTYKLLTFQNGYKRSSRRTLNSWPADLCGCGSGTVYIYQNIYTIY